MTRVKLGGAQRLLVVVAMLVLPHVARAASLLEQAEELLRTINQTHDRDRRFALASVAQSLCDQAVREHPRDAAPHIVLSRVLTVADPLHPELCRATNCERAVAELKEARKLDNHGAEAQRIAAELGLVLSRTGSYAEALAEYDRALALVDPERRPSDFEDYGRAVLYGNSAETLMALGRLDEAIERYQRAEAESTAGNVEWELAEWGLGVALDRDSQIEKARQAVQRALAFDPTMSHLNEESVFFEPAGDKHYYDALGHEVAGDRELALASWKAFVAESPRSPYVGRAKAHIAELKRTPALPPSLDVSRLKVAVGEVVDVRGIRPQATLREVARQHEDELRLCYARTLRSEPGTRGELHVQLFVDSSGLQLARARVIETLLVSSALSHCVELAASTWRFPTSDVPEQEEVMFTLQFGEP
jgi:tetratricopeptide (TPR) repeat protein